MEWVITEEEGVSLAAPCRCRERSLMKRRTRFADIPEAFHRMRLNTFRIDVYRRPEEKKKALVACRMVKEYLGMFREAEEKGMGLYLYSGTRGSGKTRMAASIANELMEVYGVGVRFAVSMEVLAEIRRTFDKGAEYTQSQVLDTLKTAEVLVLDDLGTEKVTEWVADQFYHIVNSRYVSRKVTIFTSNESLKTLRYDERITNRIKERCYQIDFPEESVREHIAEENMQYMFKKVTGMTSGSI
jgi:DNA replication protein DnaC